MADDITLRPWHVDDVSALVAAWHDDDIVAGSTPPADRSPAGAARWVEGWEVREQRLLAVDRVIDVAGECVGEVGLSDIDQRRGAALIGWWIAAEHRGQGYATAGVSAMVEVASTFGIEALVAQIDVDNLASVRVAERAGFTLLRLGTADEPHAYVHR